MWDLWRDMATITTPRAISGAIGATRGWKGPRESAHLSIAQFSMGMFGL